MKSPALPPKKCSQVSAMLSASPPVPSLPDEVVARTREKYLDAYARLTGSTLA